MSQPSAQAASLVPQRGLRVGDEVASAVGRGFGYLLIAAGIFLIFFAGLLTGAWLAFIGGSWYTPRWPTATPGSRAAPRPPSLRRDPR